MATIKEIAEMAKVSPAAVSRILNQDESLSVTPEVRKRVQEIARLLKYIPPKQRSGHGQTNRKLSIGIADWHIVRLQDTARTLDVMTKRMVINTEVSYKRMIYGQDIQVDGIIAFGCFSEAELDFMKSQSNELVFVNADQKDYQYDQIFMDYTKGMENLVHYLLDEKEYRSIGYIGGIFEDDKVKIGAKRVESLKKALLQRKCYYEKYFYIGELSQEGGYEQMKKMLESKDVPEVLVMGNDQIAAGAMEALKEADCRIPKDVAVVIYRDIETQKPQYPLFTSLQMLPEVVWSTATRLLYERIMEDRIDNMKIYLPTRVEIGEST